MEVTHSRASKVKELGSLTPWNTLHALEVLHGTLRRKKTKFLTNLRHIYFAFLWLVATKLILMDTASDTREWCGLWGRERSFPGLNPATTYGSQLL